VCSLLNFFRSCSLQLAEIKNGRLAMLAISGIVHHYFITGKGPIQFVTG
jgi:hypothetical protein